MTNYHSQRQEFPSALKKYWPILQCDPTIEKYIAPNPMIFTTTPETPRLSLEPAYHHGDVNPAADVSHVPMWSKYIHFPTQQVPKITKSPRISHAIQRL
ncbi:hypothetical protein GDO81_022758 [Engystomops pustulosus]|uniref:Uncharacterized protein n=1 Tax=Engystomops pustulosus TaxID=76066 RepID=A0AAV6YMD1_ENGPU|nr:hypothetical protein GDO81_022758 [Engystomops pustulosus]